ncbi:Major facilitator, sugar transporter-like [Dillenia turbinata]|uniref:Major facilitator, sugar transporter-like n=1 Tax=Dillenia turbinata TaxID=194707 RepID=A0AAN8URM6_9MAGN
MVSLDVKVSSGGSKDLRSNLVQTKDSENVSTLTKRRKEDFDLGWVRAFPHVLVASMSNFLSGYHIGVMNGPIVSVAWKLSFEDNPTLDGLVVSIFIAGAFIGSIGSGSLVDKLGCRHTFQVDTLPLILGGLIFVISQNDKDILGVVDYFASCSTRS